MLLLVFFCPFCHVIKFTKRKKQCQRNCSEEKSSALCDFKNNSLECLKASHSDYACIVV